MAKKKVEEDVAVSSNPFSKISSVMQDLNKHYKNDNLMKMGGDISPLRKVRFGEPALDYASDGGTPIGRFTEYLGAEHTGKTRNSLRAMAMFQKFCFNCWTDEVLDAVWSVDKENNPTLISCTCSNCNNPITKVNAFIDIEGTTDKKFLENFGIQTDGIIYSRPDKPSKAVGIIDTLMRMPEIGLIVIDSVGSMGSDKEVDTAIEDDKMNQNALFLNKAMRKWQMALNSNTNQTGEENGTTVIVINQSYVTLSIFSSEVAQGGRGLRHGKGMSMKTKKKEVNKDPATGKVYGIHIEYVNEKNKTGVPYRKKMYYLNLDPENADMGYCQTDIKMQYIDLAIEAGIIIQKGGWFEFNGQKVQGKISLLDKFDDYIKQEVDKIVYRN